MTPDNTLPTDRLHDPPDGIPQAGASPDPLQQIDTFVHLLNVRHEAIVCLDEHWHVAVFNQGAEKIFGYTREEILGAPFTHLVCRQFRIREKHRLTALTRIARENRIGFRTDSIVCRRKNGERFPTEISLSQGLLPGQRLYTLIVRDTTDHVRQAEQLAYQAGHDQLTDLPNRVLLYERLRAGIARADRFGRKLGVIYMDLDRFKPVNDRYGHETGDRLLQAVARRLGETMRRSDTISRIGGDEFIICLDQIKSAQDALDAAHKIVECLKTPFQILERELQVSASIGIAVYPDDARESETLLRLADQAMYRAKTAGDSTGLYQTG